MHVRDEDVDKLARRLAALKGTSITDAVRDALEKALRSELSRDSLWDVTADLRRRLASYERTGLEADKKFYDSL